MDWKRTWRMRASSILLAMVAFGSSWARDQKLDAALDQVGPMLERGDYQGIKQLLLPWAASGDVHVEHELALAYMALAEKDRRAVDLRESDYASAIAMANRASEHGDAEALNLLFMMYGGNGGQFPPIDAAKAVEFLKRGVAAGSQGAKVNYAIQLYAGSILFPRDVEKSCGLFKELAQDEKTQSAVVYYLGVIQFKGQCGKVADRKAGMELIRIAAEHGVREAERDVAKDYQFGWTTDVDTAQALAWYERAAAHGDPDSQWHMGSVFVNGTLGQPKDFERARGYFEGAAASGDPRAMDDLGAMYSAGEGMPKDFTKAKQLYERAAAAGFARAYRDLAIVYAQGEGVEVDRAKARLLYLQALELGFDDEPTVRNLVEKGLTSEQCEASTRQFEQWRAARSERPDERAAQP